MDSSDRFEFKFLLDSGQYEAVVSTFGSALQPDTHGDAAGVYPVVSLYYDTPDRQCYWAAWQKAPSRRKLRVRVYGTADGLIPPTSFVEIKHKLDGRGAKRRLQTSLENALQFAAGTGSTNDLSDPDRRTVEEVHRLAHNDGVRPSCVIRYRRHAYWLKRPIEDHASTPLRVTFDDQTGVRFDNLEPACDDLQFQRALLPPNLRIMELKGRGAVPFHFARQLGALGIQPLSLSKYCAAVELMLKPAVRLAPFPDFPHPFSLL